MQDGPTSNALAPGDDIAGYRIISPRDPDGASRDDYDARDVDSGRDVVLRFVNERDATPTDLARIRREATALMALAHPNVARVRGLGMYDRRLFLVLDRSDRMSLDRYVASRSPSWRALIARLVEAGRGLAAAHIRAIVHRDIGPHAIAIAPNGRARIGDFGIGHATPAPRELALDELHRLAPEQVQGRPATVFSDQFAFCVTAWRVAVGAHPFAHDSRDQLLDALSSAETPTEPDALTRPQRALWRVIQRGLHPDPAHRYPAMPELIGELEHLCKPAWRKLLSRR